jgi:hypothetical protein
MANAVNSGVCTTEVRRIRFVPLTTVHNKKAMDLHRRYNLTAYKYNFYGEAALHGVFYIRSLSIQGSQVTYFARPFTISALKMEAV